MILSHRRAGPRRGDLGTGVLSASFGITFVLVFVLLATQVSAHLLATSRLRSDAAHAARTAARAAEGTGGTMAVEAALATEVAELRTRYGSGAPELSWTVEGDEWVAVTVSVDSPARVAGALDLLGLDRISATSRVRVETPR